MNAKKILSMSAVALFTATMIVACGPKDRSHVAVGTSPGGGGPVVAAEKVTATPKNQAAASELATLLADKTRHASALQILDSVQDLTMVPVANDLRIRVKRTKTLKNDLAADKQMLAVTVPGSVAADAKLVVIATETSELGEITAYYNATTRVIDTIKIRDTSDTTANSNNFVMYTVTASGAAITPKLPGEGKAYFEAAKTVAPMASLNLQKVMSFLQSSQAALTLPYMIEFCSVIDQTKSIFQTLIIPAALSSDSSKSAPDATQSLFAITMKAQKVAKAGSTVIAIENLLDSADKKAGLGLPDTMGVLLDLAVVELEESASKTKLELTVGVHGLSTDPVLPWKIQVIRTGAGSGSLAQFSKTAEDTAPAVQVTLPAPGSPLIPIEVAPVTSTATLETIPVDTTLPIKEVTVPAVAPVVDPAPAAPADAAKPAPAAATPAAAPAAPAVEPAKAAAQETAKSAVVSATPVAPAAVVPVPATNATDVTKAVPKPASKTAKAKKVVAPKLTTT
jgi:hypothetical protein